MKQFIICLTISIALYLGGGVIANDFDVRTWSGDGRLFLVLFIFIAWLAPIMMNYLGGKPNFQD